MAGEHSTPLEVRVAGRTLTGEAMIYGQQARDRAELFEPGSLEPLEPVTLNLQHDPERRIASTSDGTLRLSDSPEALTLEADLRAGSAELELVRRGALAGSERRVSRAARDPLSGWAASVAAGRVPGRGARGPRQLPNVGRVAPGSLNPRS